MKHAISIKHCHKYYKNGAQALQDINLDIVKGEIFALLGPNGAGKTTLISIICGIVKASGGSIEVFGNNIVKNYREARSYIGLVPQELTTDAFETVWNTVSFSRGLFGKPKNPQYIEQTLRRLSLWDKKDKQIRMLSGGMKRRVMIAKALSHEPDILFLDEPSAGIDVELRKSMWHQVKELRETGVTIILTTHYIEEAEQMADRISVIHKGQLIITEEKKALMKKLGKKDLLINLRTPLDKMPAYLSKYNVEISNCGDKLILTYDSSKEDNAISDLLDCLKENAIGFRDLDTRQTSLEDIFIQLVGEK